MPTPEQRRQINTEKIPTRILDNTKWGRKAWEAMGEGRTVRRAKRESI
jgi:hypothetical protein